jgi:hypothetical protein
MSTEVIFVRSSVTDKVSVSFFDMTRLFIVLLLMSELLFLSDDHRFGFLFLQETMIIMSILSLGYLVVFERLRFDKIDWLILLFTLIVFLVPVIFSYLYFSQPIFDGLMEERRTLLYLSYFFAILVLGNRKYSSDEIEKVLMLLFWIALLWSFASAYEIIPKNHANTFTVNQQHFDKDYVTDDARFATRFLNGFFLIFIYPFYLVLREKTLKAFFYMPAVILYMLLVNQTRSLSMVMLATFFLLFVFKWKKNHLNLILLGSIPVFFFIVYCLYYFYAYLFGEPVLFYDAYRNVEFDVLFGGAVKDLFLPHGHLSLHFGNRGFYEYFGVGKNIYTADIGLAGGLYKYGFFYVPMLAISLIMVAMLYRRYKNEFVFILFAMFIGACAVMPFGDYLSRFSGLAILLLLIRVQRNEDVRSGRYVACIRREKSVSI